MQKNILIIEDDEDIRLMMSYILTEEGYLVNTFADSPGIEGIKAAAPGMILLDNRLSAGYGSDLCKQLKSDPGTAGIPVVIVSAVSGLRELASSAGADAYLDKPFSLEQLTELAAKFLTR